MFPYRSKHAAFNSEPLPRLPLITGPELLVLAVALAALLSLVFPSRHLFDQLLEHSRPDELSIAYLENLLRTEPENLKLRLLLAEVQSERVHYDVIAELLAPVELRGSADQRRQAMQIHLRNLVADYLVGRRSLPPPEIDVLLHSLAAENRPAGDLALLADSALLLGRSDLAQQLYLRIVREEPADYRRWIEPAALHSLGLGNYRLSADLYFLARQGAGRAEARRLFARGVGALMASSRYAEAMDDAERYLGELADDAPTLRFLVRTARAADDTRRAANYARRLLGMGLAVEVDEAAAAEEDFGS